MKSHKNLVVWQKSIELVTDIYSLTKDYPKEELFGLSSQMRRASISIPSNIAEGSARNHNKEFIQFLYVSLGSCAELETQLIISMKLGLIKSETFDIFCIKIKDVRNMLIGLIKSVKNKK